MDWSQIRINEPRFRADFQALSEIGKTGATGVNRPAFSPAYLAARTWLRERIQQAGLIFNQDGAGNHFAFLSCGPAGASSLLLGSHLDSVPTGGRYDGALGVLACLEVLRTVQQAGLHLPVNLELADFTDEEGTLVSFLGSFAFTGLLEVEHLARPRGDRQALMNGLQQAGLSEDSLFTAQRAPQSLAGYLELHIERGARLYHAGNQIGVVTHLAGIAFYRLVFNGRADHAGAIPMADRLDAAQGASAFTLSVRNLILEQFPGCFANVGEVHYLPGAFNIVPEEAILSLEFRAADGQTFQELKNAMLLQAEQDAQRFGLGLEIEFLGQRNPMETSPLAQAAIREAAGELGLSTMELVSRAGHDAQALARLCPVGMLFVPSVNGASHSPEEFTPWEDCVQGANVLLQAALRLADGNKGMG